MKKSKFAEKGIAKTFTLSQSIIDLMDTMLKESIKFGFFSYSEIVRRGIFLAFREVQPAYKDITLLSKARIEKMEEVKSFENMSETVYALNVLKAVILPNKDGTPFVVMHWFGNALGAKPLAGCKEWFSARLDIVDNHLQLSRKTPIEEAVLNPGNKDTLLRNYGITVPDQQTNPADTELPVS